ncbi:MAG TPA: aldehyde dehydrogenase family protein [Acidimicrobiia bacterium]|nr:aldehyde dehydrogenase family protein [Acidimicrobiia bacterium]
MTKYEIDPSITSATIPSTELIADEVQRVLARLGVDLHSYGFEKKISTDVGTVTERIALRTPITGESYGTIHATASQEIDSALGKAQQAFEGFRSTPAPARGEFVRVLGNLLREYKHELGFLVSVEAGKIVSEGLGEVQEMIDIADLAVGQSRQLFGKTIASERPSHVMRETYHPLGVVGVVTAFNFPVAVWAWNACLAFICGDPVVFKPSDKTGVSAIAIHELARRAARETGIDENISQLVLGGVEAARALASDDRIALLSVTGSTAAGAALAPLVQARFGKTLLELGGNNAMIVAPSADLDLAVRAITFSAAGTAGQRCTSLRRLIVHVDVIDELLERVVRAYSSLKVGNPLNADVLVGPLIQEHSSIAIDDALAQASQSGTVLVAPERMHVDAAPHAFYRRPGLVQLTSHIELLQHEIFAPLLNCVPYTELAEAIAMNNQVPQGLSSSIFTQDVREAELFLSDVGSDCGIANVNIGPSGAEIGGAFGGEKHTGGGRESGSDAWKAYMRRATNTVNYGDTLPLAQGVEFS